MINTQNTKHYCPYCEIDMDVGCNCHPKPHVRVQADLEPLWDWMLNNPYSKSVDTHYIVLLDMCDTALRKKYMTLGDTKEMNNPDSWVDYE